MLSTYNKKARLKACANNTPLMKWEINLKCYQMLQLPWRKEISSVLSKGLDTLNNMWEVEKIINFGAALG